MKTISILALVALVFSAVTFDVSRATDHPSKSEHPKKTEHPACAEHPTTAEHPTAAGDIVVVAGGAGCFKTFLAAIEAADLVEKFQGKGPVTVFAPTDEAFAKLPKGTVDELLKPANKAKLAGILACHVVPGTIMAADVKTMKATNVSGQDLQIAVKDGSVKVDDAMVVKADIAATNGVIHGIDTVIMPREPGEHPTSDKPKDHPAH